jgi:hypothetical protein
MEVGWLGCCQRIVCQYLWNHWRIRQAITDFSTKLSSYNRSFAGNEKKVLWEGTQHWDTLLLAPLFREVSSIWFY